MPHRGISRLYFVVVSTSFAAAAVEARAAAANVRSKNHLFEAPLSRLVWAGGGQVSSCKTTCKEDCLKAETTSVQWGDASAQRVEACLAGCGCGGGAERVFAFTSSEKVFVSADAGDSWKDFRSQVPSHLMKGASYRVVSAHVSHTDPRSVVLLTNTTTSLRSDDGGNSWHALRLGTKAEGNQIVSWEWHPTKLDMALAFTRRIAGPSKSFQASRATVSPLRVFYTLDRGVTWKLLLESAVQCRWAMVPDGDPSQIFAVVPAPRPWPSSTDLVEVVSSSDFMRSRTVLLGKGAQGGGPLAAVRVHFHFGFVAAIVPRFAADGSPDFGGLELWMRSETITSDDSMGGEGVHGPKFSAVSWPSRVSPPRARQLRGLQILYSSAHSALFFLPAEEVALTWGHVFRCNALSSDVELVLTDVHRPSNAAGPQWRAVNGIDGIFLANRVIFDKGQDLDAVEEVLDDQANEFIADRGPAAVTIDAEEGIAEGMDVAQRTSAMIVRTYLSMDGGVVWQPLAAPDMASRFNVSRGRMHLSQWLSSIAAPGVILGIGNAGHRLANDPQHHGVYISRDAGLSWTKVLTGPHHVAMLSHGDVLVAVPTNAPDTLKYSVDMGNAWLSTSVNVVPSIPQLSVDGLFVHPAHTSWRAFLALRSEASRGVIVVVADFANVLQAECHMAENTADQASDFENWSPADSLEDAYASKRPACHLGLRTYFVRRRPDRPCKTIAVQLAPLDMRRDATCQCTSLDWACAPGFSRTAYRADAMCQPMEGTSQPNVAQLCSIISSDHVSVTRGYVKVPGNRCVGGRDLSPVTELCVGNTGILAVLRRATDSATPHARVVWFIALFVAVVIATITSRRKGSRSDFDPIEGVGTGVAGACVFIVARLHHLAVALGCLSGHSTPWRRELAEDDEECEFLLPGNTS